MSGAVLLRRCVLVIKHGALGDFVLATGPMMAIRAQHLADHVTLLTTPQLKDFAHASGLFDEVWTDTRPGPLELGTWLALIRRLRGAGFHRVYDLQPSDRTSLYFHLLPRPKPEWSGTAPGASHRHDNPGRMRLHAIDRHAEQLRIAGIPHVPHPDLGWARADIRHLPLVQPYGILVPGGSAHRPAKRWSAASFAVLAKGLSQTGIQPVTVGAAADREAAAPAVAAGALDLVGKTSLVELVEVARGAELAVGNDTGPMHIAAVSGCRTVVLFSAASDPAVSAPRGSEVRIVRKPDLGELSVEEVAEAALHRPI